MGNPSSHRFHLNVTERCNIRCTHCYWDEYGKYPDPSLSMIEQILNEFKRLTRIYHETGRHVLTLGGGEPTVRDDLEDVISLAARSGFRIRLVTNAVNLTEDRARSLKKAGLEMVQVSLEGATEKTHDQIRGCGNWRRSMRGIAALKKARLFTILSCVLLPGVNMQEAPELLDLAQNLKVAGVKFARPISGGQLLKNHLSVHADYLETFRQIISHGKSISYRRMLLFFDPLAHILPVQNQKSVAGLWGLTTDLCQCNNTELVEVNGSTGDVYYCRIRKKLGNIFKEDLSLIWQHHPMLSGIRQKSPEGACKGCRVWDSCRGGCPAVVHSQTNQTLMQDRDCEEVRRQPVPLLFANHGNSLRRRYSLRDNVKRSFRIVRDLAYLNLMK